MKKQFLILPYIVMNLSQSIYAANDFNQKSKTNEGLKTSTTTSFYSNFSSGSMQGETESIRANLTAKYPIPKLPQKGNPSISLTSSKKIDMNGLWHMVSLNGQDKAADLVFYSITSSMMNVLPYAKNGKYKSYNYTINGAVIDFGRGLFDASIKQNNLVLSAKTCEYTVVFMPVSMENIQSIVSETKLHQNENQLKNVSIAKNDIFEHRDESKAVTVSTGNMLVNLLNQFSWKTYASMYGNSSISYNIKESQIDFNNDNTFYLFNSSGMSVGTYEVANGGLVLKYEDGFTQVHNEIFIEYNKESKLYFLLVSEKSDKYKGCYRVYVSAYQK